MKKDDVLRLKKAIESDRMSMTAEGMDIIIADLSAVLSDYFYLLKPPVLEINVQGGSYVIGVKAVAAAVKPFAKIC